MSFDRTQPQNLDHDSERSASLVRNAAKAVGVVFLLVGILGFIPGITTEGLKFAGPESDAKLLGLFEVSVLHNIVHLLFGVAGLAMAKTAKSATAYLIGGGVIYLVLAVFGAVIGHDSALNFVPLNTADNWLHLALGLGMIGLGVVGKRAVPGKVGAGAPR